MGIRAEYNFVYKRKELDDLKYSPNRELAPSLQIKSGSVIDGVDQLSGVRVFISNQDSKPADFSEMQENAIVFHGLKTLRSRTTWILFKKVDENDSYTIHSEGVILDLENIREQEFNNKN